MLVRPKQPQGRYSTRLQVSGSEIKNLALYRGVSIPIGRVMTADGRDDKDIKKQFRGKMQLAICWSGISHLHLWHKKFNWSSHIVKQFLDVFFGAIGI